MGAGPWRFYYNTRKAIGQGGLDFSEGPFAMQLYGNASNCNDLTRINFSELTGQLPTANGYTNGGKQLTGLVWDVGIDLSEYRFSCDDVVWTATGGDISNIRWAVIVNTADGNLVCVAELETFPMVVTNGNAFAVAANEGGIFELN